ncbi:unnamed protein product, partial [Amoebophrya sp. A25]
VRLIGDVSFGRGATNGGPTPTNLAAAGVERTISLDESNIDESNAGGPNLGTLGFGGRGASESTIEMYD